MQGRLRETDDPASERYGPWLVTILAWIAGVATAAPAALLLAIPLLP